MISTASRRLISSSLRVAAKPNVFNNVQSRGIMTLKDVKYTAEATATGAGRNGTTSSNGLELTLALPKELGGSGKGQNPEQLFAMGYSACFLGAVQAIAKKLGKEEMGKKAIVHANVSIGEPNGQPGFGLSVDIKVEGIDEELLQAAHAFCPYSRALDQGVVVNVSTA